MTAESEPRYVGTRALSDRGVSDLGPSGVDLPRVYETVRLRMAALAVLVTLTVAVVTGWPNGPWVPIGALIVLVHAVHVRRSGLAPGPMTLLIDGGAIAMVTLTMSIPVVTATAFCLYAVVASVLTVGKRAVAIAAFTLAWVAFSFGWTYAGFRGPYEPRAKVIIEFAAVIFFAIAISVVVAVVMRRLRLSEVQRQRAMEQLGESNARLEDLLETKDRFVASVSHELRTPLTGVVGLAQELAHPDGALASEEVGEIQQLIASEAKEVAAIVEDLLVAARSDIGEVAIFAKPVSLAPLVHEVLESIDGSAAPSITIEGDAVSCADPIRVKQVVRNLLTNCVRYGGDSVEVRITEGEREVSVAVSDNGPGVDTDRVPMLFDPYETARGETRHTGSVGLGLSVSRTLAQLMGGDLEYVRRDRWTTFTLTLPAVPASPVDRTPEPDLAAPTGT